MKQEWTASYLYSNGPVNQNIHTCLVKLLEMMMFSLLNLGCFSKGLFTADHFQGEVFCVLRLVIICHHFIYAVIWSRLNPATWLPYIVCCKAAPFDMISPVLINSFAFLRGLDFVVWRGLNFQQVWGGSF